MGFLDGIFGKAAEAPVRQGLPFNISTALRPVRLNAKRDNSLELLVTVKNATEKPVMASVTVEIPRALGFDGLGITRIKEVRLGEMDAQKEKTISFSICANSQTAPGTYAAVLTVNHHYRDYAHILNYAKKNVEIRAV